MTTEEPTRFANLALGLQAALWTLGGLIFTLTGAFMADWLGVAGWVATLFGVVVLIWSLMITLYANRRVTRRDELDRVVRMNAAFVIAAGVIVAFPSAMSDNGRWLLVAGIAIVAIFIAAQLLARRTLGAETLDQPAEP